MTLHECGGCGGSCDAVLIRSYLAGEGQALVCLMSRHSESIRNIAKRYRCRADDVLQECVAIAITQLRAKGHESLEQKFEHWLMRVAQSVAAREFRLSRRLQNGAEYSPAPSECLQRPDVRFERAADQRRVNLALATLDPKQSALVMRRYYDEVDGYALAEEFGAKRSTVTNRLTKALDQLYTSVGGEGERPKMQSKPHYLRRTAQARRAA